jgi:hypothetical protein
VEVVSETAVLRIIDDWWRHGTVSPTPLKAAQITLRLGPQLPRGVDATVLVTQVVGLIRDLARRGCVRALPDGSAVLSYLVAPTRLLAPTRSPPPPVGVRSTRPTATRGTGPVQAATPAVTRVVPATGGTPAGVSSSHGGNTPLAATWGTVRPSPLAVAERWAPRLQPAGLGAGASSGARPAGRIDDAGPHGTFRFGRTERIVIRLILVLFLVMTIGVVVALDRLIDIPIRHHGVLYCGDSGQPSSSRLPTCGDTGGR